NAEVSNVDFGGLGDSGSAWLTDAERGTVLSFEGTEGTSAFATVGAPPSTGTLPLMDLTNGFTWAFWAKPDQTDNNDIILGNRFNASGTEFVPSQFIKFTSRAFEWNVNGAGQGIDYPDLVPGVWAHHAVVKQGTALFYYRNGVLTGSSTIATVPNEALPVHFGGGANALEAWRGALSDVRIFNGTLSEAALAALATPPSNNPGGLVVSSISVAPNRAVTLQWNGEAGKTYIVSVSKTTSGFTPIGEVAANTFTFQPGDPVFNTAVETRLFFRIAEKIVAP
ncbi:MAG: hypothetical protein JWL81_788, partial [Verrucomicrobiales bacterium]|nr:hypothetical protein [Verrucomicrobiales bacterium]